MDTAMIQLGSEKTVYEDLIKKINQTHKKINLLIFLIAPISAMLLIISLRVSFSTDYYSSVDYMRNYSERFVIGGLAIVIAIVFGFLAKKIHAFNLPTILKDNFESQLQDAIEKNDKLLNEQKRNALYSFGILSMVDFAAILMLLI
jgi:hypothetical protein